jgi:hypothetical protein
MSINRARKSVPNACAAFRRHDAAFETRTSGGTEHCEMVGKKVGRTIRPAAKAHGIALLRASLADRAGFEPCPSGDCLTPEGLRTCTDSGVTLGVTVGMLPRVLCVCKVLSPECAAHSSANACSVSILSRDQNRRFESVGRIMARS